MASQNRRQWMQQILAAGAGVGLASSWSAGLAAAMRHANQQHHFILLWMPGGPSQMDTFDLKPGHSNGGPFKEIETNVPGIRFSEHLPKLSKWADQLAIVRSLETKEGDHSRGTYLVRTGQRPGSPVRYPGLPAAIAKELSQNDPGIPDYVSILPNSFLNPMAFGSGFLGPKYQPLTVGAATAPGAPQPPGNPAGGDEIAELRVDNLKPPESLTADRVKRRRDMWQMLQSSYDPTKRGGPALAHDTVYRRAMQLVDSPLASAFDLHDEAEAVRRSYGVSRFGQGCLMARRLIERGVSVVEVSLDGDSGLGWDTHADNFKSVERLSGQLDLAWTQLMQDLKDRGLLERTTILWIGEFGRTPEINANTGRDHFPNAWSCVLAGGGIAGGQVYGATSDDGKEVKDSPTSIPQILATVCRSVGVPPEHENMSELGRPIKLVEAEPISKLLKG